MTGDFEAARAREEDIPALKSIWRQSFGGSAVQDRGVEFMFSNLLEAESMLLGRVGGKPVTTLSVREFTLETHQGDCRAAYIYGVATLPEHRGRGYAARLMRYADGELRAKGFKASVLVPASESLFGFYEKLGYKKAFYLNKANVACDYLDDDEPVRPAGLKPVSSALRLKELRDNAFGGTELYARWDESYLEYIVKESLFYGGGVFEMELDERPACAVCHRYSREAVIVKEYVGGAESLELMLRELKREFGDVKEFSVYLRADVNTQYTNNTLPFGMIKWYDDNIGHSTREWGYAGYLTHALD